MRAGSAWRELNPASVGNRKHLVEDLVEIGNESGISSEIRRQRNRVEREDSPSLSSNPKMF